jgi:hypothetical protein
MAVSNLRRLMNIGSDCSFAQRSAFRSKNLETFRYDLENSGLALAKETSLLKAVSAKHKSNFISNGGIPIQVKDFH